MKVAIIGYDTEGQMAAERVAEVAGVTYYDNSAAITPEATISAINSFVEPKLLILDNPGEGSENTELAEAIQAGGVIHVLLMGDMTLKIEQALRQAGFTHFTDGLNDMRKIVETCYHITEPGDVVLLSPAGLSLGSIKDYKERGDQFKAAVQELAQRVNDRVHT